MGAEILHDQQNHGEISPWELWCGGMRNPIIVDISTMRHLVYGGRICGSGEDDPVKPFVSYFIHKDKMHLTHCRSYMYDAGE